MPQYQGVWTLEQQAQAQSNQQWVTDPNFKNTTLLLQADGTGSGSQNQTFLDSSTNNFFITRNGNTTQGSFSPFSQAPGYWSNYFNGSGSGPYIRFGSSSALTFGTGDFTIEFWVYFLSVNDGTVSYIYDLRDGGTGSFFVQEPANTWTYRDGAGNLVTTGLTSTTFTANQWYHVAICRASGVINFYVNGVKVSANPADTSNYATTYLSIMSRSASDGANNNTNSYTSNFRVVKGTALYTANFTPQTTPLTAVSGTSLLTCQSNRFVDNSASPLTATVDSSLAPSVQAFGPFAPALQWTPDVVGGSGYFDGSGDYLVTPSNAAVSSTLLASDFTIECWLYLTAYPSGGGSIWTNSTSNSDGFSSAYVTSSGTIGTGKVGVNEFTSTATVIRNAWNHFATVRSGATVYAYLNGVQIASGAASTYLNTSSAKPLQIAQSNQSSPANLTGYISGYRAVNSALYTGSTYTIPTTVPTAISGTQLLLNYTNAGIYDGKMANNLETVGNAQVATSPVKYGSGSMYFDGTGDYLVFPNSQNFALGSGDFTVEAWVYVAASKLQAIMDTRAINANLTGIALAIDTSNFPYVYVNNATLFTSSTAITLNTWTHLAMVRSNGIITLYVNGTKPTTGSAANTTNLVDTALTVGSVIDYRDATTTLHFNGYIDDLRITKGVARYYANFTPPQQALPRQ